MDPVPHLGHNDVVKTNVELPRTAVKLVANILLTQARGVFRRICQLNG